MGMKRSVLLLEFVMVSVWFQVRFKIRVRFRLSSDGIRQVCIYFFDRTSD